MGSRVGRARATGALFVVAAFLVGVAQAAVIAPGFFLTRLWEDEGYNLTVPLNLVAGAGYASDGILTSGTLDPFDVRISTGPVVLLPISGLIALGVEPILAGRIVGALYYLILLAALAGLGRSLGGRWGSLLAVVLPLTLDSLRYPSPLQGPTDILGEVPAAAFLALFLLLFRRHPALAGLCIGLAVQSKTLAIVAVPAAVIGVWLARPDSWRGRLGRTLLFGAAAALPTVAFELVKLATLGARGYMESTRSLYRFLRSGGQTGYSVTPVEKLVKLAESWFIPAPLVGLVVALLLAVVVITIVRERRRAVSPVGRDSWVLMGTAFGIAATWLAWWTVSSGQPLWIRHPSPALLSVVPVLIVGCAALGAPLVVGRGRAFAVAAGGAVAAVLVVQVGLHIRDAYSPWETLASQRAFASELRRLPGDQLRGDWGDVVSLAALSGRHAVLLDHSPEGTAPVLLERVWGAAAVRNAQEEWCGPVLAENPRYLVCSARDATN